MSSRFLALGCVLAPILLVLTACSAGGAHEASGQPAAAVRCMTASNCAGGQVCTAQSKGDCVLQGDVCTGVCEDSNPSPPAAPARCMTASTCARGQVCTAQSKGECVLQGNVCTGVCTPP